MNATIVLDNFIPRKEAISLRLMAENADYEDVDHGGHIYRGISVLDRCPFSHATVAGPLVLNPKPALSYFYKAPLGHSTTSWIHSDNSLGGYASILYLPPLSGRQESGTMTFTHKKTGLYGIPIDRPMSQDALEEIQRDHDNLDAWTVDDVFSEKLGRLVVYPTNRFHARFPRFGYGEDPSTSRIVLVSFLEKAPV